MVHPVTDAEHREERRVLVLGYGTPIDMPTEEDIAHFRRRYRIFKDLLLEFVQASLMDSPMEIVLVGPTGVIEAECKGVNKGDSSVAAIQSLRMQGEGKPLRVYSLGLTDSKYLQCRVCDTTSYLAWVAGSAPTVVLDPCAPLEGILDPKKALCDIPTDEDIAQQWNDIMSVRLAHAETKE